MALADDPKALAAAVQRYHELDDQIQLLADDKLVQLANGDGGIPAHLAERDVRNSWLRNYMRGSYAALWDEYQQLQADIDAANAELQARAVACHEHARDNEPHVELRFSGAPALRTVDRPVGS